MAKDVIIIPASGSLEYFNNSTEYGSIQLNDSNQLIISASDLRFSSTGSIDLNGGAGNVYIGDGINVSNIVFEQNGAIVAASGSGMKVTLGDSNTKVGITTTGEFTINGIPSISAPTRLIAYDSSSKQIYHTSATLFDSLKVTGSFVLPTSQSTSPQIGTAYWSGSFLYIYNGTQYRSASFA